MRTVNIQEAKNQFSRIVQEAAEGKEVIIAKAGKPLAKLVPLGNKPKFKRLGFMRGKGIADIDIKSFGQEEIEAMFEGRE